MIVELLIGGAFRSSYCRRKFRSVFSPASHSDNKNGPLVLSGITTPVESRHVPVVSFALPDILVKSPGSETSPKRKDSVGNDLTDNGDVNDVNDGSPQQPGAPFKHPFHDLMVWACLLNRQKMALYMWKHGDEAMAKALIASKLFKSMSHEANEDDLEEDICLELSENSKEFQRLAVELLDHCYKQVTMEL